MDGHPGWCLTPHIYTLCAREPLQGVPLSDLLGDIVAINVEVVCPASAFAADDNITPASPTPISFALVTSAGKNRLCLDTNRIWINSNDASNWDWESPPSRAEPQYAFWEVHAAIGITTAEVAADLAQAQAAVAAVAAKAVAAAAIIVLCMSTN